MSNNNNNNINNDLTLKQNYIKEHIIDKNYNKTKFFDFCMQKKLQNNSNNNNNNFGDLNSWSMNELIQTINEFTSIEDSNRQKQATKNNLLLQTQEKTNNLNFNTSLSNYLINNQNNSLNSNNLNTNNIEIPCKLFPKTILSDQNLTISIQNPIPIDNGYFFSSYILYEINTVIQNFNNENNNKIFKVQRRYSDFIWLRKSLSQHFPRFFIPPIPGKKIGSRRFELDFVEKRMKKLNKFLNKLIENEYFKSSESLLSFLTVQDRTQFEYKMKEISSYFPSNFVEEQRTFSGKVLISNLDSINEQYHINIHNYFQIQNDIFNRLNENLKDFYSYTKQACVALEDAQKDFDLLHLLSNKVKISNEIVKCYYNLSTFFKNYKRIIFNQNELIKFHIKDFFKNINKEGECFNEIINSRDELRDKFIEDRKTLKAKKEKLILKDINQWEIEDINNVDKIMLLRNRDYAMQKMCTIETKNLDNLAKMVGYANKCNLDELKKMIKRYNKEYIEDLKSFSDEFYGNLNDLLNVWSNFGSFVDEIKEEMKKKKDKKNEIKEDKNKNNNNNVDNNIVINNNNNNNENNNDDNNNNEINTEIIDENNQKENNNNNNENNNNNNKENLSEENEKLDNE